MINTLLAPLVLSHLSLKDVTTLVPETAVSLPDTLPDQVDLARLSGSLKDQLSLGDLRSLHQSSQYILAFSIQVY